jgi:hypothetical protein
VKGLSKRTTKLGFNVLRLHYSCDPEKDPDTPAGKIWYDEARRGMSDARFRQEYELDYGALGGQLVFPDFEETIHVRPPKFPLTRETSTVWLACDPHPRTPHAFLWVAADKLGDLAVVWSWWKEDEPLLISEYCEMLRIVDSFPFGLKPYRRIMDIAGKSFNAGEEVNYFDAYRIAKDEKGQGIGLHFSPARKNRGYVSYDLISEALRPRVVIEDGKEVKKPRLTIWGEGDSWPGDNKELVSQFKSLRFREHVGHVQGKDAPQDPEDKRRHLIDCLGYILMERPHFIEPRREDYDDEEQRDPNVVIAVSRSRN